LGIRSDILSKVKSIIDTNFDVEEVTYVPDIADSKLTFGNKGLKFEATVLHIDMRGSTKVLNTHYRSTVAKIHMAYFHTIVKIAGALGGSVRSFNGDSMLVFFPGKTTTTLSYAVQAAMTMKSIIADSENGINELLKKYSAIDFGIGLDHGDILCTKIGIGGDSNNKGLFWAGNAVNKAVKLGDLAKSPYQICISNFVYTNLEDWIKILEKEGLFGFKEKVNMWNASSFTYNDKFENYYKTEYQNNI
jgi:adenylate cyclase